MTTLLMSSRHTSDDQALWRAAIGREWSVVRARGISIPEINDPEIVIYIEALFAQSIAKMIGRQLPELCNDWLVKLPLEFRRRAIRLATLGEARELVNPAFVKPPNDKSFAARVYHSGASIPDAFDDDMPVLVADPVQWETEFRCFCLNGKVATLSPYLRYGNHARHSDYAFTRGEREQAIKMAESVLAAMDSETPIAVVIDVGQIAGTGWAVVEANAAWGSGIYGCDPDSVLDVIRHATIRPGQHPVG